MHRKQFHPDKAATKAAHFASRYSYVSTRIHPGSEPPHQCVYLAGFEDIGKCRQEVFNRDKHRCVDCGKSVSLSPGFYDSGELAHSGHTKISRCWCMENLKTLCHADHVKEHHGRDF